MRHRLPVFLLVLLPVFLGSCSWYKKDRCYVFMEDYRRMRDVFTTTGSMQRVEQVMKEEKWAHCERNQVRYLIAKDLNLEDLESEFATPEDQKQDMPAY